MKRVRKEKTQQRLQRTRRQRAVRPQSPKNCTPNHRCSRDGDSGGSVEVTVIAAVTTSSECCTVQWEWVIRTTFSTTARTRDLMA